MPRHWVEVLMPSAGYLTNAFELLQGATEAGIGFTVGDDARAEKGVLQALNNSISLMPGQNHFLVNLAGLGTIKEATRGN